MSQIRIKIGLYFTHRNGPIFRADTHFSDLQWYYSSTDVCLKRTVTEGASNTNYSTFAFIFLSLSMVCPAGNLVPRVLSYSSEIVQLAPQKNASFVVKNTIATSTRTMRSFCSLGILMDYINWQTQKDKNDPRYHNCSQTQLLYSLRVSSPAHRASVHTQEWLF